jgi:lysophospholipase L1-like esterase
MQFQAERHGASFLDAGTVAKVSPIDGIHFDSHNHRAIGAAIAGKIRQLIS